MLVAILAVTLLVTAGLMMLAREITRLRGTIARLERRIVALERLERRVAAVELDHAPTLVIEPDRETPPRPPNAMLN